MAIEPKKINYDVALKSTNHTTKAYTLPPEVYTSDAASVQFRFNILDVIEPEFVEGAATYSIEITSRDGSIFQDDLDITRDGTVIEYMLKENQGNHAGLAKIQLLVTLGTMTFTSGEYEFKIINNIANAVPVEIYVQNWGTLTSQAEAYITQMVQDIEEFDVALETGVLATNIAAKLQSLESTYAPEIVSMRAQLAETATKSELSAIATPKAVALANQMLDVAKIYVYTGAEGGYTAGNWYYHNGTVWTSGGVYQATSLGNGSVTPKITTFFKVGKNLFDPNAVTAGNSINGLTGSLSVNAGFNASDYITVKPSANYTKTYGYSYAWYDTTKTFISGATTSTLPSTITSPNNAAYLRVTITDSLKLLLQIEEGTVQTEFEAFYQYIPNTLVQKPLILGDDIAEKTIPLSKTNFYNESTNLYNKDTITNNAYVSTSTGALVTNQSGFVASDYIPVKSVAVHTIARARHFAFYDVNKAFISGQTATAGAPATVTTPINAKYLRTSYYPASDGLSVDNMQLNEGASLLAFQNYGGFIPLSKIEPKKTIGFLPPAIYGVVGKELNIYFQNILRDPLVDYQLDVTCTIGSQESTRWTCIPDTAGTYPLTIDIYSNFVDLVGTVSTSVIIKSASVGTGINKKMLVIGDSTLNAGVATQHLLDLLDADPLKVALYGSRGTAPNSHEGRGGWAASTYMTNTEYTTGMGDYNPFYNTATSKFDFAYYMSQKGYPALDYVVIWLGINDVFNPKTDSDVASAILSTLSNYDTIIDSIKSYDANIKIGVNITIPPNESQDAFGLAYKSGQTQWRYKRNNSLWIEQQISHFKGVSGVYLIPTNSNIDCKNGFDIRTNGGVHPNATGYDQMGDSVYYWLKSFEV